MHRLRFLLLYSLLFLALAACAPQLETAASPPLPTATAVRPTATSTPPETAVPATSEPALATPTIMVSDAAAVMAYVKDGDIHLWDEASNQNEIIFSAGDVIAVTMRDDAQEIAFLRRSVVEQPDLVNSWYEQSALWVVDRNGENARELVSAGALRELINAGETESSDFAQLEWIPQSLRLVFSGIKYIVQGEGASHATATGVYVIDAQTSSIAVLAAAESNLHFVPAPDGQHVALMSHTGLGFINTDGSNEQQDILTYPQVGVPLPIFPAGIWTQDATAFLIAAPSESASPFELNYTIWRVPVDGSPAHPLTANITDSHSLSFAFSPDGRRAGFLQGSGGYFITPLAATVGPLAVPNGVAELFWANLHWSPGGNAYVVKGEDLFLLCADASQDSDVCGAPINLGGTIQAIQWVDSNRFFFMTREPYALFLGNLEGTTMPIVTWAADEWVSSKSFSTVRRLTVP